MTESSSEDSAQGKYWFDKISDEIAYILPMGVFLGFTQIGASWKSLFPISYIVKALVVAVLLILLRKHYTKIKWNHWYLGLLVGILGIFQWVGMQLWLQRHFAFFEPSPEVFDPSKVFPDKIKFWSFVAVRMFGAVCVVPFMEEFFWRDFLWRRVAAPNDFKLAEVGERDPMSLCTVSVVFAVVHGNCWLTAIGWGLMVGLLLWKTKSLGACIIAHATTNLLLALYVLHTRDWSFW